MRIKKTLVIFITILGLTSPVFAASYYMREGGKALNKTAAMGPCSNSSATMSLATHNSQRFSPGDVIIVCDTGGSFSTTDFIPPSSGSGQNRIEYRAETGQTPTFYGRENGVNLRNGQDSLKFTRLRFERNHRWVVIGERDNNPAYSSDYIWFDQCTFYNSTAYSGILIGAGDYGRITNCVFPNAPLAPIKTTWDAQCQAAWDAGGDFPNHCNGETAPADAIQGRLGSPGVYYWVIEGNTFGNFSHNAINTHGRILRTVLRNNKSNNRFHSGMGLGHLKNNEGDRSYVLWEGNEIRNGGIDKAKNPSYRDRMKINGVGLDLRGSYIIARYNTTVGNDYGLTVGSYSLAYSNNNMIFHNTFVNNKINVMHTANSNTERPLKDNIIINNIVAYNENFVDRNMVSQYNGPGSIFWWNVADVSGSLNHFRNNMFWPSGTDRYYFKNTRNVNKTLAQLKSSYSKEWSASKFEGNPNFIETSDKNLNLNLKESSAAINKGAFLTTISGISGNLITVGDSNYFYDGWGIPGEIGDTIYNDSGHSAIIRTINYDKHQITLDSTENFKPGDKITTVRFYGTSPDIGARQFNNGQVGVNPVSTLHKPKNVMVSPSTQ